MEEANIRLVYTGLVSTNSGGNCHKYYKLPILENLTDYKEHKISEDDKALFNKSLFKKGVIGGIYEAVQIDNTYKTNALQVPILHWPVSMDVLKWQTWDRTVKISNNEIKEKKEYILERVLKPLHEIYIDLPYQQKSAFIGEVIRIITRR